MVGFSKSLVVKFMFEKSSMMHQIQDSYLVGLVHICVHVNTLTNHLILLLKHILA